MSLKKIYLPARYNYIACFLTLNCNLNCDYCINWFNGTIANQRPSVSGQDWVKALNRIECNNNLPITLQGGEPSLHPDFIWIINHIRLNLNIDILTNLYFDITKFVKEINPSRLHREAPYACIRASYHPNQISPDVFIKRILALQDVGFSVGAYGVLHPLYKDHILNFQKKCKDLGIDFRVKEFLGSYEGTLYGTYRYPDAVGSNKRKKCQCRTTELIIGSDCSIYRCHHDLYYGFAPVANLLDSEFEVDDIFRVCDQYGGCNPCDLKIKTNRFQIYGHCSVEIKEIGVKE